MERVQCRVKDREKPVTWLFCGDSITHGTYHTFGWRDYTQLFAERVRGGMGRGLDAVINTAITGSVSSDLISQFAWRVGRFRPDIVFLMIGMNDCSCDHDVDVGRFRANLSILAELVDSVGGLPVLQTTCPILKGASPDREPYLDQYMRVIRELSESANLPLVDHACYWDQHRDQHYYWMSDPMHPNEMGHRALAYTLFHDMGIFDASDPVCRLLVP